jgi:[acyl-carrier-protein] S-malonyltransferase
VSLTGSLAALFPGQGSQHVGMGADLAEAFPSARSIFERANEVLGLDLARLCWEGPEDELRQTENAQPAILVHSYAVWTVLRDDLAGRIHRTAGHSLGEFTAYAAAGSLTFDDAVRLVRRRGELMAASPAGTMSAIVGLEPQVVEEICTKVSSAGGVVVAANYNSPRQIVISGAVDAVDRAGELAKEAGAKMVRGLAVSGAFHSPLMGEAEAGLRAELERVDFGDPQFAVVSNATAETVVDAATARSTLLKQLTAPVRWTQSIQRIVGDGVSGFLELGPGKVLTGLLRRIGANLQGVEVGKADDVERFREGVK